jgi:hypothetical protein
VKPSSCGALFSGRRRRALLDQTTSACLQLGSTHHLFVHGSSPQLNPI